MLTITTSLKMSIIVLLCFNIASANNTIEIDIYTHFSYYIELTKIAVDMIKNLVKFLKKNAPENIDTAEQLIDTCITNIRCTRANLINLLQSNYNIVLTNHRNIERIGLLFLEQDLLTESNNDYLNNRLGDSYSTLILLYNSLRSDFLAIVTRYRANQFALSLLE